jgi:hypothetical protein
VLTLNRFQGENGSLPAPDQGAADPEFVRTMLAQDRASRASRILDLQGGVTDVKLFRITIAKASFGVHARPN